METVECYSDLDLLYLPTNDEFSTVIIPAQRYLMIDAHLMVDGQVNPEALGDFQTATEALFSVSSVIKNQCEQAIGRNYVIPPLESLWWVEGEDDSSLGESENWDWTSMIMVPDWIDQFMISEAIESAKSRKPNPMLTKIRVETLWEGKSVQILFIGALGDEATTIDKLRREYIPEHGFSRNGKHHEIYLSDPQNTEPDNFRMIIRQPVM